VHVLKSLSTIKLFGGNSFRKVLIVIQFALALIIIIFTSISSKQFNYIANAHPGYNRDNLLVIPLQGTNPKILATEIRRLSGVQSVTASSETFGRSSSGQVPVKLEPGANLVKLDYYDVDTNFVSAMNLKIIAGQAFPNSTTNEEKFVMLNETAARILGFNRAANAIGKTILINDSTSAQIVGVLKDFHFQTLAVQLAPLILRNRPTAFNYLLARTNFADKTVVAEIKKVWKNNYPQTTFKSSWLKEDQVERQAAWGTVSMLGFLSFITITIACLGLLGMVIYNTETRRKEIGIRKVMGASVTAIISLLSKSFVKLIVISGLIALPVGYVCGFLFINVFANHITIGLDHLLLSFIGLLAIVLITISSQIYRVATANPVNSLRNE
jgi:putative ABC transport system permease protein